MKITCFPSCLSKWTSPLHPRLAFRPARTPVQAIIARFVRSRRFRSKPWPSLLAIHSSVMTLATTWAPAASMKARGCCPPQVSSRSWTVPDARQSDEKPPPAKRRAAHDRDFPGLPHLGASSPSGARGHASGVHTALPWASRSSTRYSKSIQWFSAWSVSFVMSVSPHFGSKSPSAGDLIEVVPFAWRHRLSCLSLRLQARDCAFGVIPETARDLRSRLRRCVGSEGGTDPLPVHCHILVAHDLQVSRRSHPHCVSALARRLPGRARPTLT